MPGTDPAMPAVRACHCGRGLLGTLPECVEHSDRDALEREVVRAHGLYAAAHQDREKAIVDRDLAWLFRADALKEIARLKAEIKRLRDEPPSTEQAPVLEG